MAEVIPEDINSLPLREKRLGHDLRGLVYDPPEGNFIRKTDFLSKLDKTLFLSVHYYANFGVIFYRYQSTTS